MPVTETTIGNNYSEYLEKRGAWAQEVSAETPDQRECAFTAIKIMEAFQAMRDASDMNVKGQCAHTLLILFKDLRERRPTWIVSVNRFLDREEYKGADVQGWAHKAWRIFNDWKAIQKTKQEADNKKAQDELAKLNRQLRGQS